MLLLNAQTFLKKLFVLRTGGAALQTTAIPLKKEEPSTHTGQMFKSDDYRRIRFVHNPKMINDKFAIDLIQKVPAKVVDKKIIACDGGGNRLLGHPRIFLDLGTGDYIVSCNYCGLRYRYKPPKH